MLRALERRAESIQQYPGGEHNAGRVTVEARKDAEAQFAARGCALCDFRNVATSRACPLDAYS